MSALQSCCFVRIGCSLCVAICDLVESGKVWFGNEDRKLKLTAVRCVM